MVKFAIEDAPSALGPLDEQPRAGFKRVFQPKVVDAFGRCQAVEVVVDQLAALGGDIRWRG